MKFFNAQLRAENGLEIEPALNSVRIDFPGGPNLETVQNAGDPQCVLESLLAVFCDGGTATAFVHHLRYCYHLPTFAINVQITLASQRVGKRV